MLAPLSDRVPAVHGTNVRSGDCYFRIVDPPDEWEQYQAEMTGAALGGLVQRRRNPRQRFSCRARFRDLYALGSDPWRACVTRDFSSDGIYLISGEGRVQEGMKLLLRFCESTPGLQEREFLVEVMRADRLLEERWGVGARLILSALAGHCENLLGSRPARPARDSPEGSSRLIDLYA
jgi:PilZ domain